MTRTLHPSLLPCSSQLPESHTLYLSLAQLMCCDFLKENRESDVDLQVSSGPPPALHNSSQASSSSSPR